MKLRCCATCVNCSQFGGPLSRCWVMPQLFNKVKEQQPDFLRVFFQHDSDFSFQADSRRTDMKEMKLIAVSSLQEEKSGKCF